MRACASTAGLPRKAGWHCCKECCWASTSLLWQLVHADCPCPPLAGAVSATWELTWSAVSWCSAPALSGQSPLPQWSKFGTTKHLCKEWQEAMHSRNLLCGHFRVCLRPCDFSRTPGSHFCSSTVQAGVGKRNTLPLSRLVILSRTNDGKKLFNAAALSSESKCWLC